MLRQSFQQRSIMVKAYINVLMFSWIAFMSFFYVALTSDPNPLQDLCIADYASSVGVNGFACKDASLATADDFLFRGVQIPGNISNGLGVRVKPVSVLQLPGLNTQGISMLRGDFTPFGENPPHIHPRATEITIVLEGSIYTGFITSSPENKLFAKVLQKGDVFVIPEGHIHFQYNVENSPTVMFNFFNSQNAGVQFVTKAVFGSDPPISSAVLAKAFQVDNKVIAQIQSKF